MSNQAPVPAPSAPAPVPPPQPVVAASDEPTQQQLAEDALLRLAHLDIPAERRRLKALTNVTPDQLLMELHGTTLDIVQDIARNQVEIRDWQYKYMSTLSEHIEALEARLDTMDQFGAETTLTPDDADVITKAVLGCKYLAQHLLQGPFPIEERDEDGKQKLAELVIFAEQAEKIIADNTLVPDEDDDDVDESVDGDVGPS